MAGNKSGGQSNQMSKSDASRIQSTQAKGGADMSSKGFAARAQSAADRNSTSGSGQSGGTGGGTGQGTGSGIGSSGSSTGGGSKGT